MFIYCKLNKILSIQLLKSCQQYIVNILLPKPENISFRKIKIINHYQNSELLGFRDDVVEGVTKPEEDDDVEAPPPPIIGNLLC